MVSALGKLNGILSFRKVLTELKPKESPPESDEVEVAVEPYVKQRSPQSPPRDPFPSTSNSRHSNGISINGNPSVDPKSSALRPRSTSGAFSMPRPSTEDIKPSDGDGFSYARICHLSVARRE